MSLIASRLFRFLISWIPFMAYAVRQYMNLRMMIMGRRMATDNSKENNHMTQLGIDFMESQIKDPELREIVRPYSKCNLHSHAPILLLLGLCEADVRGQIIASDLYISTTSTRLLQSQTAQSPGRGSLDIRKKALYRRIR